MEDTKCLYMCASVRVHVRVIVLVFTRYIACSIIHIGITEQSININPVTVYYGRVVGPKFTQKFITLIQK